MHVYTGGGQSKPGRFNPGRLNPYSGTSPAPPTPAMARRWLVSEVHVLPPRTPQGSSRQGSGQCAEAVVVP
jgi:hypothetical protein